MGNAKQAVTLRAAGNSTSIKTFQPLGMIKCEGAGHFRTQVARDVGCLLDVNPSVTTWRCMPAVVDTRGTGHVPDFQVTTEDGDISYLDAPDRPASLALSSFMAEAGRLNTRYQRLEPSEVYDGFRLQNARDLLRYAGIVTPLGDRLRLLTALDENGSMPMSECLKAFQEVRAVAGIASLILHGYLEVELDDAPLGPETTVRRIRR